MAHVVYFRDLCMTLTINMCVVGGGILSELNKDLILFRFVSFHFSFRVYVEALKETETGSVSHLL